jgi:hypothetical protein
VRIRADVYGRDHRGLEGLGDERRERSRGERGVKAIDTVKLQRRERVRGGEPKENGETDTRISPRSCGSAAGGAYGSIQHFITRDVK